MKRKIKWNKSKKESIMDKTLKIIRKGNVGYKKIYVKKGVVNNRRGNKKINRKYR